MGERGPSGQQGVQGIQGPKGDTGPEGPKGEPGLTASVEVNGQVYTADDAGKITLPDYADEVAWGNIKGNLNNQTDLKQSLGAKQNVISDLADIREGAALGKTSLQDDILPILVTKNTEQTITSKKTFNEKVAFGDEYGEGGYISGHVFPQPDIATPSMTLSSSKNEINPYNSYISLQSSSSSYESSSGPEVIFKGVIRPLNDGKFDIGTGINRIKDLYISGNLTDGTSNNRISVANIASKSEIPTTTSQLTNDSNFVTSTELATKQDKLDSYSDSASVANNKLTINYKVKQEDGTYSNVPVEFEPQGGGSNYTFTDGLTETDGTVSLNLNDTLERASVSYNYANELIIKNGWDSNKSAIFTLRNQDGGALVLQPAYSKYSSLGLYIKPSDAVYWSSNNKIDLGKSSSKFKTIYATNLSDGTTTKTMTEVISGTTEEWTFTLSDGTTVTKNVKLG